MDLGDTLDLLNLLELAQARYQSSLLFAIMIFAICLWYLSTFVLARSKPTFRQVMLSDRVVAADLVVWHPHNASFFQIHKARQGLIQKSPKLFAYETSLAEALAKQFLDPSKEWKHALILRADTVITDADREALVSESMQRHAIIVTSADLSLPFVMPRKLAHRLVIDSLLDSPKFPNRDPLDPDLCLFTLDTFETLGVPIYKSQHKIQWQTLET